MFENRVETGYLKKQIHTDSTDIEMYIVDEIGDTGGNMHGAMKTHRACGRRGRMWLRTPDSGALLWAERHLSAAHGK